MAACLYTGPCLFCVVCPCWDVARHDREEWPLQELRELLEREIDRCEALLEAEADRSKCKWPILTMARLLELRESIHALRGEDASSHPIKSVQFCSPQPLAKS